MTKRHKNGDDSDSPALRDPGGENTQRIRIAVHNEMEGPLVQIARIARGAKGAIVFVVFIVGLGAGIVTFLSRDGQITVLSKKQIEELATTRAVEQSHEKRLTVVEVKQDALLDIVKEIRKDNRDHANFQARQLWELARHTSGAKMLLAPATHTNVEDSKK